MDSIRINLGCGTNPLQGWINVDIDESCHPDVVHNLRDTLPFPDNYADEILISHVLMYFTRDEHTAILKECSRILKPDGLIRLTEDNVFVKIRDARLQEQYGDGQLSSRLRMVDNLKSAGFVDVKSAELFSEVAWHLNYKDDPCYPLPAGKESVYFLQARKGGPKTQRAVYLTFDDFGEEVSNMDMLWKLRNYFDDFKVSMFAVPDWCGRISWMEYLESITWIELYVHGFYHTMWEELDDKTLRFLTSRYFKKGYKAPMWQLSAGMYERLVRLGFKIFLEPTDQRAGIKYNWDIRYPPPETGDIHGYGHIYLHDYKPDLANSLYAYFDNILKLPKNTRFELYQ